MHKLKRISVIALFGLISLPYAKAANPVFISFDVTGAQGTIAVSINDGGDVTGSFTTGDGNTHGFVRDQKGTIAIFDPPGSSQTQPLSIANDGTVTGSFFEGLTLTGQRGFLRDKKGSITVFDVPGAQDTHPTAIGNNGAVTGSFSDGTGVHGFIRDKDGHYTTFDTPGLDDTEPIAINGGGSVAGSALGSFGFIRHKDGSMIVLNFAGIGASISGINDAEATVGSYNNVGFLRDSTGTFTTIAPPNSFFAQACAINNGGTIAGLAGFGSLVSGFSRDIYGVYTSIPLPAGQSIAPFTPPFLSINNAGSVTGSYGDFPGTHGFIFTP